MEGLQEIKEDVKEIKADVKEISKILATNTASLIVHEARTTLAEKRIEKFESGAKWILGLIFGTVASAFIKLFIG